MMLKKLGYAAVVAIAAAGLVIGSAGSSEAKAKKKSAAAAPASSSSLMCWGGAPVCGARNDMKFNYRNACWAAKDGAKVVAEGACPAPKAAKAKKAGKKMAKKPAAKKKM